MVQYILVCPRYIWGIESGLKMLCCVLLIRVIVVWYITHHHLRIIFTKGQGEVVVVVGQYFSNATLISLNKSRAIIPRLRFAKASRLASRTTVVAA